jgi:hypothetical protein
MIGCAIQFTPSDICHKVLKVYILKNDRARPRAAAYGTSYTGVFAIPDPGDDDDETEVFALHWHSVLRSIFCFFTEKYHDFERA